MTNTNSCDHLGRYFGAHGDHFNRLSWNHISGITHTVNLPAHVHYFQWIVPAPSTAG